MHVFEVIVAMLLGGAALTGVARRLGIPYPAMVALAGAALALIPGTPTMVLDPSLALTLFVAPVLLDAAFDASPRDLQANWRAVAGLAVGAVVLTVFVVAVIARLLIPDISWAVAIALGAIVSPPDAAAATAVLRQLRPPHRLLVILEGESLFNDASALIIYQLAVSAVVAGGVSALATMPLLLSITVGSVVLGLVLSRVMLAVTARVHDTGIAIVTQFCGTFFVWILAEQLHLSGILTIVVFAMAIARRTADVTPARIRVTSYSFWEVAVFVLNVLAFILIGFQLKDIVGRIAASTLLEYVATAAVVCAAVIFARIGWVAFAAGASRWRSRRRQEDSESFQRRFGLSSRAAFVVGWSGMRGIVTLATALALPQAFPHRDLMVFIAFSVVLGTLVLQGVTIRPLMLALRLKEDDEVEREVRLARVEVLNAALEATDAAPGDELSALRRRRYELLHRRASALAADVKAAARAAEGISGEPDPAAEFAQAALVAARHRLQQLRAAKTIGDAAFQRVEEELDREELVVEQERALTGGM